MESSRARHPTKPNLFLVTIEIALSIGDAPLGILIDVLPF